MDVDLHRFFNLLKSSLFNIVPDDSIFDKSTDWEYIEKLAAKQTVSGLIADAALKLPTDLQPPKHIYDKFRRKVFANLNAHNIINNTLYELSNFYHSNGIDGIVLKGQAVAQYYPTPELRQCGDIDFYVGASNYERAKELAKNHWQIKSNEAEETSKHFSFKIGLITIELHKIAASSLRTWKEKKFQNLINEHLATAQPISKSINVLVPSHDFNSFFIFYHAYRHIISGAGIGLRQIADWALVLHKSHDKLDMERLRSTLEDFRLMRPWQIMSNILVENIGLPKEEVPFYKGKYSSISRNLLTQIIEGGNFGRYSKRYIQWAKSRNLVMKQLIAARNLSSNFLSRLILSPIDVSCIYLTKPLRRLKVTS